MPRELETVGVSVNGRLCLCGSAVNRPLVQGVMLPSHYDRLGEAQQTSSILSSERISGYLVLSLKS